MTADHYPSDVDRWCFDNYGQSLTATLDSGVLCVSTHDMQSILRLAAKLEAEVERLTREHAEVFEALNVAAVQLDDKDEKLGRLRQENAELREQRDQYRDALDSSTYRGLEKDRKEIERLTSEIERLKAVAEAAERLLAEHHDERSTLTAAKVELVRALAALESK
jgi:chromosome segregation ATPase